jgi:hypothetical protein
MKRLLGILGVALLLSGCNDSTQDVALTGSAPEAPPDSIVAKDGVTVEFYGSGHPKSSGREAMQWTQSDVAGELERLVELGYSLDPTGPVFAYALAPDGRTAEITWFPLNDGMESDGAVVHIRVDGEESVQSFGTRTGRDEPSPEDLDKGRDGPDGAFGYNTCMEQARSVFQNCVSVCLHDGGTDRGCRRDCIGTAIFVFIYCIFISS